MTDGEGFMVRKGGKLIFDREVRKERREEYKRLDIYLYDWEEF